MIKRGHQNLIVVNSHQLAEEDLEKEIDRLELLLRPVGTLETQASAAEIADLNRYRLVADRSRVLQKLKSKEHHKPFVFLINRN